MEVFSIQVAVRPALRGGPRPPVGVCRDAEQVAGDHAEPDGPRHAVSAMIATPLEVVATLEDSDPPLGADPPAHPAAEPALPLVCSSRGRLRAQCGQDDPPAAPRRGERFVRRRTVASNRRGEVRRPTEALRVRVEREAPQRPNRRAAGHGPRTP